MQSNKWIFLHHTNTTHFWCEPKDGSIQLRMTIIPLLPHEPIGLTSTEMIWLLYIICIYLYTLQSISRKIGVFFLNVFICLITFKCDTKDCWWWLRWFHLRRGEHTSNTKLYELVHISKGKWFILSLRLERRRCQRIYKQALILVGCEYGLIML